MTALSRPRFASVALDVDSTLCGIEGIDWLAERKGGDVAALVAAETESAMRGDIPLESVYARRLSLVSPSVADVEALSHEYTTTFAPGAERAVRAWMDAGVAVVLLSGGIRRAILPVADRLGIPEGAVHAVDVDFDDDGGYRGFDDLSPLSTAMGKREVLSALDLARPILAVGDGSTDVAMRAAADAFAAFTGFAARAPVSRAADYVVTSFDDLSRIIFDR